MRRPFRFPFTTRRTIARDIDDELAFHLAMREETLRRRGVDAATARAQATTRFGDADRVRDECLLIDQAYAREVRIMDWLESLRSDVRFAFRGLRKRPTFTAVAVATLALGIGATSAVFSLIDGVLLRPLPFPRPDRLVWFRQSFPEKGLDDWTLSQENVAMYRDRVRDFESFAAFNRQGVTVDLGGRPHRVVCAVVTGDFFTVLGVDPSHGRRFTVDEDSPGKNNVAILSDGFWRSEFNGAADAIGKTIDVNGTPTRIVGVMPPGFVYPSSEVKLFIPLGLNPTKRFGWFLSGVARLRPGASLDAARASATDIMRQWARGQPGLMAAGADPSQTHMRALVTPLRDAITGDVARPLAVLQAAVGVILLIAVANVATLLLGRASARSRELAMRTALGATRARVARQLITESVVLAGIGGMVGIALAALLVRAFTHSGAASIPRLDEVHANWRVVAFTAGVSIVAGMLFGLSPVFGMQRSVNLARMSEQKESTGRSVRLTNNLLIVAQLALSFVLLVSAGLVLKSFRHLVQTDLGFDPDGVTAIALPLPMQRYMDQSYLTRFSSDLLPRVAATPGVRGAGLIFPAPYIGGVNTDGYLIEGHAPPAIAGSETQTIQVSVSPGTFSVLRIPMRFGRDFDVHDDAGSLPVVVVDEALAKRYWSGADAVGKRMRMTGDTTWRTIVGVVGAVRDEAVASDPRPHTYFPLTQNRTNRPVLVVRTGAENDATIVSIRRTIAQLEPAVPLDDVRPLAQSVGETLRNRRLTEILLASFAIVALLLAAVGIHGVMSLNVIERRREFGIRLAIGAEPADLLRLILGEGALLAVSGIALGGAGAWLAARWVRALLYEVSPGDPTVYASLGALLAGVTLASCLLPARRAGGADPLVALRAD
jgi:putative ABC transport system permease protein